MPTYGAVAAAVLCPLLTTSAFEGEVCPVRLYGEMAAVGAVEEKGRHD